MTDSPLKGVGVLVTRPRAQASDLIEAIESRGGTAICFPVLEIVARDRASIESEAATLPAADIVIFVSSNAVTHGLDFVGDALTAAIGPATAAALLDAGQNVDIVPADGFDSESLLREPALLNVQGRRVRIVRGSNGRELLAETLRERGAIVDYLAVYSRELPKISDSALLEVETAWLAKKIDVVTIMSVETLHNLLSVLPESLVSELTDVPLVTPAARVIKETLERFPASRPVLASGTHANDMVEAIIAIHKTDPGLAP
jgi:uroporphyrinogen-III synthase